jgi:hypothetical protein
MQVDADRVPTTIRRKDGWRRVPKVVGSGKVAFLTIEGLDQRTLAARRAKQMVASIEEEFGNDLTTAQKQMTLNAAILSTMIEDLSARWLIGERVDFEDFTSLINTQRRLLSAL